MKKKVISVLVGCMVLVSLSACGRRSNADMFRDMLEDDLNNMYDEIDEDFDYDYSEDLDIDTDYDVDYDVDALLNQMIDAQRLACEDTGFIPYDEAQTNMKKAYIYAPTVTDNVYKPVDCGILKADDSFNVEYGGTTLTSYNANATSSVYYVTGDSSDVYTFTQTYVPELGPNAIIKAGEEWASAFDADDTYMILVKVDWMNYLDNGSEYDFAPNTYCVQVLKINMSDTTYSNDIAEWMQFTYYDASVLE